MRTVSQLKQQIYKQVQKSGYLKNIEAQIKTHVLELIDKESNENKQKLGFFYEHPVLKKLRNYPLTSLCLDLIQEFLESFKFKYTLSVFKKQINRDLSINRTYLNNQFTLDLSTKNQPVLVSIIEQISNPEYKIPTKPKQPVYPTQQKNNYVNENEDKNEKKEKKNKDNQVQSKKKNQETSEKKNYQSKKDDKQSKNKNQKYDLTDTKKNKDEDKKKQQARKQEIRKQQLRKQEIKKQQERKKQEDAEKQRLKKIEQEQQKQKQKQKEKEKEKEKGKKSKKEQEKPPQGASDLLIDVVSKFNLKKTDKKLSDEEQFRSRKAYSQEKQAKKIIPQQSGSNKIHGVSLGKPTLQSATNPIGSLSSTFLKYSTFTNQASKNQQIKQQLDQFQQSKDSTRKNPLYSSSQSGLDKSYGYDQSVDSSAIQYYQYFQKAKKINKKY